MIRLGVITATRAEYGLLRPLVVELRKYESDDLKVDLIVTGTHLSADYGMTVDEIVSDGVRIDYKITIPVSSATPEDISADQAVTLTEFTKHFVAVKYDAIFITNPTTMHIDTLHKLMNKLRTFFIEKPLRPMGCKEDSIDSLPSDKVFYVACPLRYTGIVRYLKDNIDWNKVYSLRAMSSSYLSEWRPETDYSKCYSARKELGGGVAVDLIHEWDYISYLIGKP